MPAKPTKYGIRADPHNGYVNEFDVYIGRPQGNRPEVGLGRKVIDVKTGGQRTSRLLCQLL